jgi:hypothetical protein
MDLLCVNSCVANVIASGDALTVSCITLGLLNDTAIAVNSWRYGSITAEFNRQRNDYPGIET